jgi:hypothetical protein
MRSEHKSFAFRSNVHLESPFRIRPFLQKHLEGVAGRKRAVAVSSDAPAKNAFGAEVETWLSLLNLTDCWVTAKRCHETEYSKC